MDGTKKENDEEISIILDMPGFKKENVEVTFDKDTGYGDDDLHMLIKGQMQTVIKGQMQTVNGDGVKYSSRIYLPNNIYKTRDIDIKTEMMTNGQIKVTLPKVVIKDDN